MKHSDYERLGIHSRLNHVIKKSGGYNYKLAGELLMKEYKINNREVAYEMAKNENIRDEIDCVGLDAVVKLTRESIKIRKIKFNNLLRFINKNQREPFV